MPQSEVLAEMSAYAMIEKLVEWGFLADEIGSAMISKRSDSTGRVEVKIDDQELVGEATTSNLLFELQGRDDFIPFPEFCGENVADGLRHFRAGENGLAEALLAREFDEATMMLLQPVLHS